MDLATIREYLLKHHPGKNVRIVGLNVVVSYWRWDEARGHHISLHESEMVTNSQRMQAYKALLIPGGPNPTWAQATDLAIKKYANGMGYISVRLSDITKT